jgi:hypothetical protein
MIRARIVHLDFMDAHPVAGAAVETSVAVVPRFRRRGTPDEIFGPGGKGDGRQLPKGVIEVLEPDFTLAAELPAVPGHTGADGAVEARFDVLQEFQRVRQVRRGTRQPDDVVALLRARLRLGPLDQRVGFLRGVFDASGPTCSAPTPPWSASCWSTSPRRSSVTPRPTA